LLEEIIRIPEGFNITKKIRNVNNNPGGVE
jgi:hypothetical protein